MDCNCKAKLVKKIDTVAPWIGGKHHLADTIGQYIREADHKLYAEVFFGMGNVFFKRGQQAHCEIINDINNDIINLFRVLTVHFEEVNTRYGVCNTAKNSDKFNTQELLIFNYDPTKNQGELF